MTSLSSGTCGLVAKDWLSTRQGASSLILEGQLVDTRFSGHSKGFGLFAKCPIPAFTTLLREAPVILMRPNDDLPELYALFTALEDNQRSRFLSLSHQDHPTRDAALTEKLRHRAMNAGFADENIPLMVRVANIMQTNAFNVDLQDGLGARHRATFLRIARINHSCAPNAHVCFYPPQQHGLQGRMVVRSLKPLTAGEEVLISYFSILLPRAERQDRTQKWRFECNCPICDQSLADQLNAEQIRARIRNFTSTQSEVLKGTNSSIVAINRIMEIGENIVIVTESAFSLFPALPDLYEQLGMLQAKALLLESHESAREAVIAFLEQATIWEARLTGPESPAIRRRLLTLQSFAGRKGSDLEPQVLIDNSNRYTIAWC